MVLRCAWGTCNNDERYPERMSGCRFIPFPKPKTQFEKCLRWIKACGRPHDQLNIGRINKHKAVCSKHFVGGNGPTDEYPDPVQADGSVSKPARKKLVRGSPQKSRKRLRLDLFNSVDDDSSQTSELIHDQETGISTQTEEHWVSPMDMLAASMDIHTMRNELEREKDKTKQLELIILKLKQENQQLQKMHDAKMKFGIKCVLKREQKVKDLFKYYTGITYQRFKSLFQFLIPENFELDYEKGRMDIKSLSQEDNLFLVLTRLRHNFGLKDIATRFDLSVQSAGSIFNTWIDHMYLKLGQLSIWPHRDIIITNMPKDFKADFPRSLVIIDGTEFKTQTPSALGLQSQMYSDYKSNTTLKGLIGCDPSGSVIFISELFTGSISDKAITEQSGFYELLSKLKEKGYVAEGDSVMADKGFTIEKELESLGLNLNIPPFTSSGAQMTAAQTFQTQKIAKHRVHIERLIAKVKTYQILANVIPTNLFHSVNKIWTICSILTLFQDTFVTDKKANDNI